MDFKIIILVTGESCTGKDHCAHIWSSAISNTGYKSISASISNVIKAEYADATGADGPRLLNDRAYKEQHRPALSAFYRAQVQQRPNLANEQFLRVVRDAEDVDILFITGMRDDAPVANFSPLVPANRLLEIRVEASKEVRRARGGAGGDDELHSSSRPDFTYDNNENYNGEIGLDGLHNEDAREFAIRHLLPLLGIDIKRFAAMVRTVPDFPRPGINFRHVLGIVQQSGGLHLYKRLMYCHFRGNIPSVPIVFSCETGGLVFASAMAESMSPRNEGTKLVLIRNQGKLPPPLISTARSPSHISSSICDVPGKGMYGRITTLFQKAGLWWSSARNRSTERTFEMDASEIPEGLAQALVVDDVLATGNTLCAVLSLLVEAGVAVEAIQVMVVAEFPSHGGRKLLLQRGFGRVMVQSLLVFDGA